MVSGRGSGYSGRYLHDVLLPPAWNHTPMHSLLLQPPRSLRVALPVLLAVLILPCPHSALGQSVTVFRNGDGYNAYRIPALIKAANGELLAFCEAREGGDASQIDLVLKRSSDGGRTWSGLEMVQAAKEFVDLFEDAPPPITVGNPAPVVDHLDPQHPGRIWLPFTLENDRVFVTCSDDHGRSWAPRREITSDVKRESWGWYATGPVHSIQLQQGPHRGRLVIPADHRLGDGGADRGPNGAQVLYSDDHGHTWKLGAIDDTYHDGLNANETTVVELSNGRLYFNTRDQHGDAPGTRGEAFSSDGGRTFDPPAARGYTAFEPASKVLDPPVVQCALLRASFDPNDPAGHLILFSGPDENGPSGQGRSDLRLRWSSDEARTWNDGPLLHVGPAAYSDMAMLDHAHVGVLYEAGTEGTKRYDRIDFQSVALGSIRKAPK